MKLWDVETAEYRHTLDGDSGSVWSITFSPGGKTLASGSWKVIDLWDAATGEHSTHTHRAHGFSQ